MATSSESSATVGELGERAVLARILPLLPQSNGVSVGPGDDSAVISIDGGQVVSTCDMMVEGPDFRRDWSTPYDLGWKAMASNLADIAAMGAVPRGVIVAVAAPPDTRADFMEEIARGISAGLAAMAPGCGVIGGDLSASAVLTLAVTVLGDLEGRRPILRSGARPGDVVAHIGQLGSSERGLRILASATEGSGGELPSDLRDGLRRDNPDVAHHLAPVAPIAAGPIAAIAGASAMMDVSDGLILDATRMAEASGVAIDFLASVIHSEEVATGGEDHGLLVTFPPDVVLPDGFRRMGKVVDLKKALVPVTVEGKKPPWRSAGWDPYRDRSSVVTRVSP
jgi:thiamine-monophosphate kinase